MAASRFGGSILKYAYHLNLTNTTPAQFCFSRGFSSTLFVKGISFKATEFTLAESFSKFGKVIEAKVIMDKNKKRSKGYGYVSFATEEEASRALTEMNGKLLDGRVIFVDKAMDRRKLRDANKLIANLIGGTPNEGEVEKK
ncbi:hypothetical protein SLEP1_g31508 [Rubroshorea leprosula]|uniref:RRM domain-containing protein n=1 Tax=Rubroshorea leprosula TaxID=152421 RepID=A0AAV5K3J7_9ROSI|nr:hypothetical protein SLEP1_g31508 [Rubroshorea leprosula]